MNYLLSFLFLISFQVLGAEIQIPALTSPVMDEAGLLSENERSSLSQLAYEIYSNHGPQITIFTVPDLQGYPIEEFSIRVAEKWQLGTKEKDNGLLIVIAKSEREMRIEVGNGIEGEITDYDSNKYIRNILTPSFKQGDFYGGLRAVLEDVAKKFNIQSSENHSIVRRSSRPQTPIKIPAAFPILLFSVFVGYILLRKHPVARGIYTGAGLAGGSFLLGVMGLIIPFFVLGLVIGVTGLSNFLFALAQGSRYGGGGRSGGFGGGSDWGGGGGGFSGGGSSGRW
ncbi:MAG: YgcG family protein [Bacteriovoracaceae bacterium]